MLLKRELALRALSDPVPVTAGSARVASRMRFLLTSLLERHFVKIFSNSVNREFSDCELEAS